MSATAEAKKQWSSMAMKSLTVFIDGKEVCKLNCFTCKTLDSYETRQKRAESVLTKALGQTKQPWLQKKLAIEGSPKDEPYDELEDILEKVYARPFVEGKPIHPALRLVDGAGIREGDFELRLTQKKQGRGKAKTSGKSKREKQGVRHNASVWLCRSVVDLARHGGLAIAGEPPVPRKSLSR